MKKILVLIIVSFLLFCAAPSRMNNEKITGYDFSKPQSSFTLPDILHEVSGITEIDSNTIACVQDENGILFLYNITTNKITHQYAFNINGDYEGIARVDKNIYVLRSDGVLLYIEDYTNEKSKTDSIKTGIPCDNNEGLCYDAGNNRLLIGCKGKPGKGPENNGLRVIYSFDLQTQKLSPKPVFTFKLDSAKALALKTGIKLEKKKKTNGTLDDYSLSFFISGMCIHPFSKKLYTVSSRDHLLFIMNADGSIGHVEQLDEITFNKPEGIAFLQNGDLLISNEGQNKKPSLYRFAHKGN